MTLEEAKDLHYVLWNYIYENAEILMIGTCYGSTVKNRALGHLMPGKYITHSCFACEYAHEYIIEHGGGLCSACPIIWPNMYFCTPGSLYSQWCDAINLGDVQEMRSLAIQIRDVEWKSK